MNERCFYTDRIDAEATIEPIDNPGDQLRSLYTGDISTSILQKFASWDQVHNYISLDPVDHNYFCVRSDSSTYKCYIGHVSAAGYITGPTTVLTYESVGAGGYSTAYTWSVAQVESGRVDLNGYNGYIYSSYEGYAPNPYMQQYRNDNITSLSSFALLILCAAVFLGFMVWRWIKGAKRNKR